MGPSVSFTVRLFLELDLRLEGFVAGDDEAKYTVAPIATTAAAEPIITAFLFSEMNDWARSTSPWEGPEGELLIVVGGKTRSRDYGVKICVA